VEELDSDDTDTQGVGLNFEQKRFASDPLHFTGIDISSRETRARRSYSYDSATSDSYSEISEYEGTNALQIALRDKEEALVQSALARIRRAQEKGKREVKLNQDELDALEKRRKRMQAAATTKEKKGSASGSDRDKKRGQRQLVPLSSLDPKNQKKAKGKRDVTPPPPGLLIAGPDGSTSYAPLGYYPSQAGPSRNSPARPRSSASQHLYGGGPPPQYSSRHFSDGTRPNSSSSNGSRRPLPDEEGWMPTNSRRGSVASQPIDPFEYQTSSGHPPAIPSQYMQGRRNASGPEVAYSSVRRSPPVPGGYPSSSSRPSSSRGTSDPTLRRRQFRRDDIDELAPSSEDEDESDDLGNGVQVFVQEQRVSEREKAVSRKPVGAKKKGKGR